MLGGKRKKVPACLQYQNPNMVDKQGQAISKYEEEKPTISSSHIVRRELN